MLSPEETEKKVKRIRELTGRILFGNQDDREWGASASTDVREIHTLTEQILELEGIGRPEKKAGG